MRVCIDQQRTGESLEMDRVEAAVTLFLPTRCDSCFLLAPISKVHRYICLTSLNLTLCFSHQVDMPDKELLQ